MPRYRCPDGVHDLIKSSPEAFISGTETLYAEEAAEGEFVSGRCRGCGTDLAADFGREENERLVREHFVDPKKVPWRG